MSVEFQRVKEIFLAAVGQPDLTEREAWLRSECAEDETVRRQVEALLGRHDIVGNFLEPPGLESSDTPDPDAETFPRNHSSTPNDAVGSYIGPYQLLEQLGEGGMGTVYLAEQVHPIKRRVALKVIKAGMDSAQVIARFEQERQALELMDHPHIAKVLDAGMTDAKHPYFVMELVQGVPVTRYCDQERLTPRERLELFIPVCLAVQHAHQKGVIHRDLKPSNVLVATYDGKPVPKVIDFGIAKATGRSLAERSLYTEVGVIVGTLEYMAPEQAELNNVDIDTRADVYSLGVLLYELLTGSLPFTAKQLRGAGFGEMLRMIKEVEPPKPSTKLSSSDALPSIAANRNLEPATLTRLVRGELDWIVMKALEKDRNRRYETASSVALDVQRYLNGEVVAAAPPSAAYRAKKFVRRNRGPVLASAAVVVALIAGIVGTTIGLIGQTRQRVIAEEQRTLAEDRQKEFEQQAAIASAVTQFQFEMMESASPSRSGEKVTVLQVMLAAVKDMDSGKLKDKPLVEANVREMIGSTFHVLGRDKEAEPNLREALRLRRSASKSPWWIARAIGRLAVTLQELSQLDEAEALMREAVEIRRTISSAGNPETAQSLADLGMLLQVKGKYAEAETVCREAVDIYRQCLPAGHPDIVDSLGKLGWLLQLMGKYAESEVLCREALDIRRRNLPTAHPDIAQSLNHLGAVLAKSGRPEQAEPLFREMLEIDRKSLPEGHHRIGQSMNNLASALHKQGKISEAEHLLREGLEHRRKSLPAGHPYIAQSLKNVAAILTEQGKYAEAEPLAREGLAIRRKALPAGHPDIAGSLQSLGALLRDQGKFADGEAALLEAEKILGAVPGLSATTHDSSIDALVRHYTAWNQSEPGQGYNAKADQWKAKLSTTRSATNSPP